MTASVYLQLRDCRECQSQGLGLAKVQDSIRQIPVVSKVWYTIGIDLITSLPVTARGNTCILTGIDYFSKFPVAVALPNKEAITVQRAFHDKFYCQYGPAYCVITDNGKEFRNKVTIMSFLMSSSVLIQNNILQLAEALESANGVRHCFTRPRNPRCNGAVEKFNDILQRLVNCDNIYRACNKKLVFSHCN